MSVQSNQFMMKNNRIKEVLIAAGFGNNKPESFDAIQIRLIDGISPINAKQDNYMRTFNHVLKLSLEKNHESTTNLVVGNIMKSPVDIQEDFFSMVEECEPHVRYSFSDARNRYLAGNGNS